MDGRIAAGKVWVLAGALALASATGHAAVPGAQEAERSMTGVWILLLEGHQIGFEVEQKGSELLASLHQHGRAVPMDGTIADGRFTLSTNLEYRHANGSPANTITGVHKGDDTLEGDIELPSGRWKWTAERLKKP